MDGKLESVASVVAKPGEVAVYDLSVDDPHNYFADGFLVHNKSILRPFRIDLDLQSGHPSSPSLARGHRNGASTDDGVPS